MLLLTNHDVARVMDGSDSMAAAIEVIERALLDVAVDDSPRSPVVYPTAGGGVRVISVMGTLPSLGLLGGRINSLGKARLPDVPSHRGYKLIFDLETLNLVCMLEDGPAHPTMVGAHVGVATRWLARQDARTLGALGSGVMALASVAAVCSVRPIESLRVYSPNPEHRATFAERVSETLNVTATAVDSAEAATRNVDILTCATNNHFRGGDAVFDTSWLSPGAHVNTIGRSEADVSSFRTLRVFPMSLPDFMAIEPPWGPLRDLVEQGVVEPGDLARVIAGDQRGREADEEITLYVGPSIGAEHLAIGAWIYRRALEQGIGLDWNQDQPASLEGAGAR